MHSEYAFRSYVFDNVVLVLKEGLRGIRHLSLYARSLGLRVTSHLPGFLRRPTRSAVSHVDHIAEKVERRTSNVVHHYLDPEITRDSETATFAKILSRENAPVLFAKTTYDNLKITLEYLSPSLEVNDKFFISEMLSACAYRKAASNFDSLDEDCTKAGLLVAQLIRQGAIRTHMSKNATKSSELNVIQLAKVSCFAHMLWLVIAREYVPERERDLLYACCDLCVVIFEQIEEAGDDPQKLGELLKVHAEII